MKFKSIITPQNVPLYKSFVIVTNEINRNIKLINFRNSKIKFEEITDNQFISITNDLNYKFKTNYSIDNVKLSFKILFQYDNLPIEKRNTFFNQNFINFNKIKNGERITLKGKREIKELYTNIIYDATIYSFNFCSGSFQNEYKIFLKCFKNN